MNRPYAARIGIRQAMIRFREAMIGLREAKIGLREAKIGLREAKIGLREANIGLREAVIGLHEAMIGLHEAMIGLHEAMIGLHEAKIGLREAVIGLREAMIGLKDGATSAGIGRQPRRRGPSASLRASFALWPRTHENLWHRHSCLWDAREGACTIQPRARRGVGCAPRMCGRGGGPPLGFTEVVDQMPRSEPLSWPPPRPRIF